MLKATVMPSTRSLKYFFFQLVESNVVVVMKAVPPYK